MCHYVNDRQAWQCRCGYEFGQDPDVTRTLVRSQLVNLRIGFIVLLVLVLAAAGLMAWWVLAGEIVVSPFWPCVGLALLVVLSVRTGRKILLARRSLRSLDRQKAPLPKAVARRGGE